MASRNQIECIVFQAIDKVNDLLLAENAVPKDAETVLLGQGAVLDSMGFVNFIVALEETLLQKGCLRLNLVEALNDPTRHAPTQMTASNFIDFVFQLARARA